MPLVGRRVESRARRALLVLAPLGALLGVLQPLVLSAPTGSTDPCSRALRQERWQLAVTVCQRSYAASGFPHYGLGAARAHFRLKQRDDVLRWRERLAGTSEAAATWRLWGHILLRAADPQAKSAFARAIELDAATGNLAGQAQSHYALFYLAYSASDHQAAFAHLRESLRLGIAANDGDAVRTAVEGLASLLGDVGDTRRARLALAEARRLFGEQSGVARARALTQEAAQHLGEQHPRLALQALDEAAALMPGGALPSYQRGLHLNRFQAHLQLEDVDAAARSLDVARSFDEEQDPNSRASLGSSAADLALARGALDEARRQVEGALAVHPGRAWSAIFEGQRAAISERQGDPAAARVAYERVLDLIQQQVDAAGVEGITSLISSAAREPLEGLFRLQAAAGDTSGAIATLERARARDFLNAFARATRSADDPARASPDLLGTIDEGGARFVALARLLQLVPRLSRPVRSRHTAVPQLLAAVGARHVLAYQRAGDTVYGLVLAPSGKGARLRALASAREIAALTRRLLGSDDDDAAADRLGELLLPRDALPPAGTPLYVIADDALDLARVPFAALRRDGRFVVEEHAVVHLPSLHALATLQARAERSDAEAVVVGDPRGNLPAAEREAQELGARLGVDPLLGREATLAVVRAARDARLLHLAAHSHGGPRGDVIELADGELGAADVLAAGLAPRLVVLASCASGVGARGGTTASLALAFLAAGSANVLASLHSVDDAQAREFLLEFYREGGAVDPLGALASTQRAWIERRRPARDWAAFALFGIGR